MPNEGDVRDCRYCKEEGYRGTQKFHANRVLPGEHEGLAKWGQLMKTGPIWVCDRDSDHDEVS